jgi:hypothetical protein
MPEAKRTKPGYLNRNGQINRPQHRTAREPTEPIRLPTWLLRLRLHLRANDSEIHLRLCPKCPGGAKGLPYA